MRENSNMNLLPELIQTQLFQCHREERRRFLRFARNRLAISLIHLKKLPRPFRARNDIVKIYIAFILDWQKLSNYSEFNKPK